MERSSGAVALEQSKLGAFCANAVDFKMTNRVQKIARLLDTASSIETVVNHGVNGVVAGVIRKGPGGASGGDSSTFQKTAPAGTNVVGIRIRPTNGETKLFRDGDYPVVRGTALLLGERDANLWTNGYLPQLNTYIGPETPNPLFITALKSRYEMPPLTTILDDIMGLTKINYNSCNFNDGLPVTVRFANMVGDVLTMGSAKGAERQPFKFYV